MKREQNYFTTKIFHQRQIKIFCYSRHQTDAPPNRNYKKLRIFINKWKEICTVFTNVM